MTRLRLGLIHLRDHKFKQFSGHTEMFLILLDPKSIYHLLQCYAYRNKRKTFLNKIKNISTRILEKTDFILSQTLLTVILRFIVPLAHSL